LFEKRICSKEKIKSSFLDATFIFFHFLSGKLTQTHIHTKNTKRERILSSSLKEIAADLKREKQSIASCSALLEQLTERSKNQRIPINPRFRNFLYKAAEVADLYDHMNAKHIVLTLAQKEERRKHKNTGFTALRFADLATSQTQFKKW